MLDGELGYIDTPLQGNKRPPGVVWCADNGCFNEKTFSTDRWWTWLQANTHDLPTCKFATAPDVVGNHHATLARSLPWLPRIRHLGYPAAFVAQDGATPDNMPWHDCDAVFIGGTTDFKLGPDARDIIAEARKQQKWVHAGRVNSKRRYFAFAHLGADSCDGTYLVFGPEVNLPKLLSWVRELKHSPTLYPAGEHL